VNLCQLGHETHEVIEVPTLQGMFQVFDTARYMDNFGFYCPGQDALSQNLGIEGQWEVHDTRPISHILDKGERSRTVIDFGCHIGWYTIMAATKGYRVLAIDGDPENLRLLAANAALRGLADKITIIPAWVDETFTLPACDVELVKIDIESHDRHAVAACLPFIDRIQNMYVEISPTFRPDYPEKVVAPLLEAGFHAYWPDDRPFDHDYTLTQFNLRFSR
jgi:SAM-dependent methyltransferase